MHLQEYKLDNEEFVTTQFHRSISSRQHRHRTLLAIIYWQDIFFDILEQLNAFVQ